MRIRPATEADLDAIAAMHRTGWITGYRGLVPERVLDDVQIEDVVADWRSRWAAAAATGEEILIAEAGEPVGFCSLRPGGPALGEIENLHVLPQHRSTGVGARLLTAGTDRLHELGCGDAFLWVLRDNTRARRFYEREGWLPDGAAKTEPWDGFPVAEVRYVRRLG
jgi:ribosomal protein S18 acetylase RimI-like enzyme